MMNPDLIVVWPKNLDYPPFRLFVKIYRYFFNEVYVVFTDYESMWDFEEEVVKLMEDDHVSFCFPPKGMIGDWRDNATNFALKHSKSDWILFMEQDFMIRSGGDLKKIWKRREISSVIGFKEAERLHPGFLLVSRKQLEGTSKDFSAKPDEGYDHFGKFTKELKGEPLLLDDIGIKKGEGYMHMNGLSHNINLCMRNETKNIYRKEEFIKYMEDSIVNSPITQRYVDLQAHCLKVLEPKKKKKKA